MRIVSFSLEKLRKFDKREFNFSSSYNIITGRNGAGKTSVFEGIYLLSTGKSFITNHLQNCIKFGEEYFFTSIKFESFSKIHSIELLIGQNRKEIKFDNKKIKTFSEIIGVLPVLFMNYKLSLLIKGGPENRRNFLNHLLIFTDKEYYVLLLKYYSLLYRRNAVLKENGDKALISVLTDEIVPVGSAIQERRENIITELVKIAQEMFLKITNEQTIININYKKSDVKKLSFKETQIIEAGRRRTLFGPHLDEMEILRSGVSAREFSSLGEAYGIAFALRFAENKIIEKVRKESPVILLDDFFSDLDELHRKNILDLTDGQQVFVSALSLNLIPDKFTKSAQIIVL